MTTTVNILTTVLGILMFLPGLNKFFEPAKTKFYQQINLSHLPFTDFTYWLGITGELLVGIALVTLVLAHSHLRVGTRDRAFYFLHFVTLFILAVAFYVHLHPNVPAEYLPLAKPPIFPTPYVIIACANCYLYYKHGKQRSAHTEELS